MGSYVKCDKCGNMSVEVIGDNELACEVCSEDYYEKLGDNDD